MRIELNDNQKRAILPFAVKAGELEKELQEQRTLMAGIINSWFEGWSDFSLKDWTVEIADGQTSSSD